MRIFYLLIAFTFSTLFSHAQGTTGFSGTGSNIDVDNYQIFWRINPDSLLGLKGSVKIKFRTTTANVTSVSFDLRNTFTVSSVVWNGSALATTPQPSASFKITIPVNIPLAGTRDSVTISYSGIPPVASGAAAGYNLDNDAGAGNNVNTLSESYEDRDWWPCKADMQDKADTIDITVNVPYRTNNATLASATDTFWVASNGTLIDSTIDVSGTQARRNRTFKYINRYPMASYLVCVAVARYKRYYRGTIDIGASTPVPVVYYLYAGKADYTGILSAMDKATEALQLFSTKFGNYGFTDPAKGGKHGFYEGLSPGGGMEHQTFSAIGTGSLTSISTLIHELQHQWFGDKVSFSTWNDLWLAEGFAEYAPGLAAETITGLGYTKYSYMSGVRSSAIAEKGPVYIPASGIVSSQTIWAQGTGATGYGSTVYNRGAMVVSMLRKMCGDTKFFNTMKSYQTNAAWQYKSASTAVLKQLFTDSLGTDVSEFFTDNVENAGYPFYTIGYQYSGTGQKTLALKVISQARRLGSVNPYTPNATVPAYFSNPVVVHVKGAAVGNDTTIVFYDWDGNNLSKAGNGLGPKKAGNVLTYKLSFTPTSIVYDDSLETMSSGVMQSATIALDLKIIDFMAKPHAGYNDATLLLDDNSINTDVILERSADGNNFTELGSMQLWAGSAAPKKYVFNDMQPLKTDNYYRAKYKNEDGIYIYYKIVKIGGAKAESFTLVNNPVRDMLQIRASSDAVNKKVSISIFDASSKMIMTKQVINMALITEIPVDKLAPGVYFIRIAGESGDAQNIKFIKQ